MGVINLAHGSFYMIGAYLAFSWLVAASGRLPLAAVGIVLAVAFGYLLSGCSSCSDREHLQPGADDLRPDPGVRGAAQPPVGTTCTACERPEAGIDRHRQRMTYPVYRLFVSGWCLLLALGMYLLITKTRLGMMIRAGSDQPRDGASRWASTSSCCTASCSPPAWRWPCSPG